MTQTQGAILPESVYENIPERVRPLVRALNQLGISTEGSWAFPLQITVDADLVEKEQLEAVLDGYPNRHLWKIETRPNWARGDSVYTCHVLYLVEDEAEALTSFLEAGR